MKNFLKQILSSDSYEEKVTPVDAENAVRRSITVSGRVQGVGFRFFVQQTARPMGITGWVKNLSDGSVTMEVQSSPEILDKLVERLKKGNGFSKIVQIKSNDLEVVKGEDKFGIRY